MEMKQRIIGLVVLLALGIILVPLIFDSETVIKPDSSAGAQAAAIPSPTVKLASTPINTASHIIQPGQIEASAEKILDHQPQMSKFASTEQQDFEDRDEEESAVADADADEPLNQPHAKKPDSAYEIEHPAKETPVRLTAPKNAPEKTAQLKSPLDHSPKLAKTQTLSQKSDRDEGLTPPLVWAIQLGVFSEVANANNLATELKSKGFHAFVEHDQHNKQVHRVLIGPEKDRSMADKIVSQLEAQHQIKSIVVRFNR